MLTWRYKSYMSHEFTCLYFKSQDDILLKLYILVSRKPSLGFTENGPKKRKYPVSGRCVDENAMLMS